MMERATEGLHEATIALATPAIFLERSTCRNDNVLSHKRKVDYSLHSLRQSTVYSHETNCDELCGTNIQTHILALSLRPGDHQTGVT